MYENNTSLTNMETQVNTENVVKGFQAGYDELSRLHKAHVRYAIMSRCDLSYHSFYQRMSGRSRVMKLEIPVIENIFAEYNINPWTGEGTL